MNVTFNYNRPSALYQIMSGTFYDADLDTSLTNEDITEVLSLITDAPNLTTGLDYVIKMLKGGDDSSPFNIAYPITGITSNSQLVYINLQYKEVSYGYYFTNLEPGGTFTYESAEYRIRARDSDSDESEALVLNAKCINELPTFDLWFENLEREIVDRIEINEVGDGFVIYIEKIKDAEDGESYLRRVDPGVWGRYIKLIRTPGEGEEEVTDIELPGFTLIPKYDTETDTILLIYICNDLAEAAIGGSQNLRVALYDSMGVMEQTDVSDISLHKNRTINDRVLALNIDAVDIILKPIDSLTTIGSTEYKPIYLSGATFVESSSNRFISIPFTILTATSETFSLAAVLESDSYGSLQSGVGIPGILCPQLDSSTTQTKALDLRDIKYEYFNEITSNALYGVIKLPIKANWWGNVILTIYAGVGINGAGGTTSETWRFDITPVNNAPILL